MRAPNKAERTTTDRAGKSETQTKYFLFAESKLFHFSFWGTESCADVFPMLSCYTHVTEASKAAAINKVKCGEKSLKWIAKSSIECGSFQGRMLKKIGGRVCYL